MDNRSWWSIERMARVLGVSTPHVHKPIRFFLFFFLFNFRFVIRIDDRAPDNPYRDNHEGR